jgi:hypothetical protein
MKNLLFVPIFFCYYFGMAQQSNTSKIIGTPITLDDLVIAQFDFPKMMNWHDAKAACDSLGNGWRLPSKDELVFLFQNKYRIGVFKFDIYWSSSEYGTGFAWFQNLGYGGQYPSYKLDAAYVRAIRAL